MAFGLMTGTKHSALVLLPALGAVFVVSLTIRFRDSFRPLGKLALFCTSGFLILGAYNYLLNMVDIGRPIFATGLPNVAPEKPEVQQRPQPRWTRPISAEGLRYLYQTMDWVLVKPIPGADILYAMNTSAYRAVDELLNLELEAAPQFDLGEFGMRRIRTGEMGFGPLGYAMAVASPLVLVIMLALLRRGTRYSTSAILLVLALGSVLVVSYVRSWTPAQVRYLTPAFALLTAALIPHTYSRRPLALLWLLPMAFLALWSAYGTAESRSTIRGGRAETRRLAGGRSPKQPSIGCENRCGRPGGVCPHPQAIS